MARQLQYHAGDKRTVVVTVVQINEPDIHLEYPWRNAWVGTILTDSGVYGQNRKIDGLSVGGRPVCPDTLLRHLDRLRVHWRDDPRPFTPTEPEEDEPEVCERCGDFPDEVYDDCDCECHN